MPGMAEQPQAHAVPHTPESLTCSIYMDAECTPRSLVLMCDVRLEGCVVGEDGG
jgi:hypothetical protein